MVENIVILKEIKQEKFSKRCERFILLSRIQKEISLFNGKHMKHI